MKDFMLVFRGSVENEEAFARKSPQEMQAEMALWQVWMEEIAKQGKMVGGQPLFPHGKVIKGRSKKLTDGPFIEGKDIVGGYLVIKANDYQDAIALSQGCPTLNGPDGSVEIREIMPIPE
jgi:hypothetical protein